MAVHVECMKNVTVGKSFFSEYFASLITVIYPPMFRNFLKISTEDLSFTSLLHLCIKQIPTLLKN
jgi:hypothetical protein